MGLQERRARERAERKAQILDAARSLLMAEGLQGTSINKIAERAELGVGTLYFYFESKEEIFAALQEEGLECLYVDVKTAMEKEKRPADQLAAIARTYVEFSKNTTSYFDIINYFLSSPGSFLTPHLKEQVDEYGTRIIDLISQTVQAGIDRKVFKAVNPRRFAITLWGALHGIIQFRKLKMTVLSGERHEELLQFTIDYLIHSLEMK
ncbi:MAG: TetR/AcrR family transcriptional regulator [Deltaproteobacteria bacterium]